MRINDDSKSHRIIPIAWRVTINPIYVRGGQSARDDKSHIRPSTSCTGVCLAITMLQYYICLGIVLTVILVLGLGLGFGIILYFVIGT